MRKLWIISIISAPAKTDWSRRYGRILDRLLDEKISPRTSALSVRILEWMACSYRRLKIYEIVDGVSIRPDCPSLDRDTKLPREVLDFCRPLIEDGPSNTLIFVHFSAQEWVSLSCKQPSWYIYIEACTGIFWKQLSDKADPSSGPKMHIWTSDFHALRISTQAYAFFLSIATTKREFSGFFKDFMDCRYMQINIGTSISWLTWITWSVKSLKYLHILSYNWRKYSSTAKPRLLKARLDWM